MRQLLLVSIIFVLLITVEAQENLLCKQDEWSKIEGSGGTWTFYNDSNNNCKLSLTNTTNGIARMWLGTSDGKTFNPSYSHEAYEYTVIFTLDANNPSGDAVFGMYHRMTKWNTTNSGWNKGQGYGLYFSTQDSGRIFTRALDYNSATVINPVLYSQGYTLGVTYKLTILVNTDDFDLYSILVNDSAVWIDKDFSSYSFDEYQGTIGIYTYYTDVTIHSVILKNQITLAPSYLPTNRPSVMPTNEDSTTNNNHDTTTANEALTTTMVANNGNDTDLDIEINENGSELSELHAQIVDSYEIISFICLFGVFLIPFILCMIGRKYHQKHKYYGCDKPNYKNMLLSCIIIGNFYCDVLFCLILILLNNSLWYFAAIFVMLPYIAGNMMALVNISSWQDNYAYMKTYLVKYGFIIILLSCIIGFYACVELICSKLFYLSLFSMPFKRDHFIRVRNFRLLNIVFFENVPQLVIEILYISDTGELDIFVGTAMLFTILSIIINVYQRIQRCFEQNFYLTSKIYKMHIQCHKLVFQHKYINNLLSTLICDVLSIENTKHIDVFYIIPIQNGIIAYIQASNNDVASEEGLDEPGSKQKVRTMSDDTTENVEKGSIHDEILKIGQNGSSTNELFKGKLNNALNLDGMQTQSKKKTVDAANESGNIVVTIEQDDTGIMDA